MLLFLVAPIAIMIARISSTGPGQISTGDTTYTKTTAIIIPLTTLFIPTTSYANNILHFLLDLVCWQHAIISMPSELFG